MARNGAHTAESATSWGLVLPGDRPADVVVFESEVVDFFVDAAELLGVPKSVAAIYGIVFASPAPLAFADIEARLDISKGSVSQGLRILRAVGALKEVSEDGERSARFEPDLEMRKLIQRFLEQRVQRQLAAGKARLDALKGAVPALKAAETKALHARVEQLQNWHDRTRALLPVIRTFLKLGG